MLHQLKQGIVGNIANNKNKFKSIVIWLNAEGTTGNYCVRPGVYLRSNLTFLFLHGLFIQAANLILWTSSFQELFDGHASASLPSNGNDTHITTTTKCQIFGRLLKASAFKTWNIDALYKCN